MIDYELKIMNLEKDPILKTTESLESINKIQTNFINSNESENSCKSNLIFDI